MAIQPRTSPSTGFQERTVECQEVAEVSGNGFDISVGDPNDGGGTMTELEWRELYNRQLRYAARMPGYRREETPFLVRYVSLHGDKGYVLWSNLATSHDAFRLIQNEATYFHGLGQPFEWKLFDYDQPGHLGHILKRLGFSPSEPETVMVVDWRTVPAYQGTARHAREITDDAGIRDLMGLEEAVWSRPFGGLESKLRRDQECVPQNLVIYGVYDGDSLVSGAWMYLEPGSLFASLWGGATLPAYRGQGCYTALLHARGRRASLEGHPFLTVDASAMSRAILEKWGFICLGTATGYQSQE